MSRGTWVKVVKASSSISVGKRPSSTFNQLVNISTPYQAIAAKTIDFHSISFHALKRALRRCFLGPNPGLTDFVFESRGSINHEREAGQALELIGRRN
jgi:hypothetical protein